MHWDKGQGHILTSWCRNKHISGGRLGQFSENVNGGGIFMFTADKQLFFRCIYMFKIELGGLPSCIFNG